MVTYLGKRLRSGERAAWVDDRGRRVPLCHIVRHSPTGIEWGYGGSGPADLALSILTDAVARGIVPPEALDYYNDFKWTFVAFFPSPGWTLTGEEIARWWEREGGPLEKGESGDGDL